MWMVHPGLSGCVCGRGLIAVYPLPFVLESTNKPVCSLDVFEPLPGHTYISKGGCGEKRGGGPKNN